MDEILRDATAHHAQANESDVESQFLIMHGAGSPSQRAAGRGCDLSVQTRERHALKLR
jgi:hypothetical protein